MQHPLTLPPFVAWLESQPPARTYHYLSNEACLIALYLRSRGFRDVNVYTDCWSAAGVDGRRELRDLPSAFNRIAQRTPWTFGAALGRVRAARTAGGETATDGEDRRARLALGVISELVARHLEEEAQARERIRLARRAARRMDIEFAALGLCVTALPAAAYATLWLLCGGGGA